MKRVTDADVERASNEATDWLILLQEEPDDAELRQRFDEWLKARPENVSAWASTQSFSDMAALLPAVREAGAVTKTPAAGAQVSPMSPRTSARRWAMPALALAAAACLALWTGPAMLLQMRADHVTGTAELRQVDLPDGSRVILAPASAIAVTIADDQPGRRVELLSGEAFFQVRPDPARPFRVRARDVETTVLGTRFDVRLGSDDVAVSVEEGIVAVATAGAPIENAARLVAGQFVRVASDGLSTRGSEQPELVAAWRQGQLYAQETRLGDAIDQLRRYFGGTIVLTDGRLADRRITGAYNLADPEDALRGMARVHGAKVRRLTPWLLVVSAS
ncbi:FecR family protein [Reyranella sp.]|uniref:FecR family protein n=1 Tax=Reyranella sp. TaxID=1929291 RepID=UPI004035B1B3